MTSLELTSYEAVQTESIFSKLRHKTRMPAPTTFIQQTSHSNQTRTWNKRLFPFGKEEVKLPLFIDDMILYIENPKKCHQKAIRINTVKLQKKINIQRSIVSIHQQWTLRKRNEENNLIYNWIDKNKISKNDSNQGGKRSIFGKL